MKKHYILIPAIALTLSACSNKEIYEYVKSTERQKCARTTEIPYDECIQEASKSYKTYKTEREEVLKK